MTKTKAYRLRHKPTGLYYTPLRGHGNLSRTGKIYANKNLIRTPERICVAPTIRKKIGKDVAGETKKEDWEIVEL